MMHNIKLLLLLPLLFFCWSCSSDEKDDAFPGARFLLDTDTLRLKAGDNYSVKIFYGRGVLDYYRALPVWSSDDELIAKATYNSVTTGNDSCYALGNIKAGYIGGATKVYVNLSLGKIKKTISLNVRVTPEPLDTTNTKIPEGAFVEKVNGLEFVMIPVAGGNYIKGPVGLDTLDLTKEQIISSRSEQKVSDLYVGQTEVTQELWTAVMGENPCLDKDCYNYYYCGPRKPVLYLEWYDCETFLKKLYQLTGHKYRLPTRVEWQYVARGGKNSKGYRYAGSNNPAEVAWYSDNSSTTYGGAQPHRVGEKLPNELGIYDMTGNVKEICSDSIYFDHRQDPEKPDWETCVAICGGDFGCPIKSLPIYKSPWSGIGYYKGARVHHLIHMVAGMRLFLSGSDK